MSSTHRRHNFIRKIHLETYFQIILLIFGAIISEMQLKLNSIHMIQMSNGVNNHLTFTKFRFFFFHHFNLVHLVCYEVVVAEKIKDGVRCDVVHLTDWNVYDCVKRVSI